MLRIKNDILSLILLISLGLFACGGGGDGDPDLTPQEQRLLDLGGSAGITWVANSITFEGSPATGFENFSLTIRGTATSKTYSSNDGNPVFRSGGSWDFNNNNINQVVLDGNTDNVFNISNFNASGNPATFTLTVNFTNSGGAAAGTNGTYVFNLREQ